MVLEIGGVKFLTVQGALDLIESVAIGMEHCTSPYPSKKRCKECLYCAWEVINDFYQKETRNRLGTSINRMKV